VQLGVRVRAYDPVAMNVCREQHPDLRIVYCNDALSAAEHADALVIVTEWPEFGALDLGQLARRMNSPVLIDGRNLFSPELARAAGFDYAGIGRTTRNGMHSTVQKPAASSTTTAAD
jgi:UDPglucose 6-dehydrogenase